MDKTTLEQLDPLMLESGDDQYILKGIDPYTSTITDLKDKEVLVITNNIKELTVFLEHNLYCIFTKNMIS